MDNALRMSRCQGIRNLDTVARHLVNRQRATLETRGERLSFEQLHHQVVRTYIEDRADMGMTERGYTARFMLETRAKLFIDYFDSDCAAESCVARSIHFPHAARADGCEDFIWTEMFAGRLRHRVSTD